MVSSMRVSAMLVALLAIASAANAADNLELEKHPWFEGPSMKTDLDDLVELAREAESSYLAIGATGASSGLSRVVLPQLDPPVLTVATKSSLHITWVDDHLEDTWHPDANLYDISLTAVSSTDPNSPTLPSAMNCVLEVSSLTSLEKEVSSACTGTTLPHATTFDVTIRANNTEGWNTPSETTQFTTAPQKANAVRNLTVSSKTESSVTLCWARPSDDGGATVTSYSISRSGTNTFKKDVGAASPLNICFTDTNLVSGHLYAYIVTPFNGAPEDDGSSGDGLGTASAQTQVVLYTTAPMIESIIASDPDNGDAVVSVGDVILVTFDRAVDRTTAVASNSDIIKFLNTNIAGFSTTFTGTWVSARQLQLTIDTLSGTAPGLGTFKFTCHTPSGETGLRDSAQTSLGCSNTSPALTGNWGTEGLENLIAVSSPPTGVNEDVEFPLSALNLQTSETANYKLRVSVVAPTTSSFASTADGTETDLGNSFVVGCGALNTLVGLANRKYKPNANFNGEVIFRASVLSCDTDAEKDFKIITVTYHPVNDAPTISMTNPSNAAICDGCDATHLPLTINSDAGTVAIAIADPDDPDGNADIQVTLNPTDSGRINFDSSVRSQDGVTFVPSATPSQGQSVILTGPMKDINTVLALFQPIYYITVGHRPNYHTDYPDNIQIAVNDMSNGGGSAITVTRTQDIWVQCETASAPTFSSTVQLQSDYRTVHLGLTAGVTYTSATLDCANIIDETLSEWGTNPVCRFRNGNSVALTMGYGATVLVSNSTVSRWLKVKNGAFKTCGDSTATSNSATLQLTRPSVTPPPHVEISGPNKIGFCETRSTSTVRFDGTSDATNYGRTARWWWSVTAPGHSTILDNAATDRPYLEVSGELFVAASYTFSLTVENWLGDLSTKFETEVATFTVDIDEIAIPTAVILKGDYIDIFASRSVTIQARADPPRCDSTIDNAKQDLVYLWEDAKTMADVGDISREHAKFTVKYFPTSSGMVYTNPTLRVPANHLTVGESYILKFNATLAWNGGYDVRYVTINAMRTDFDVSSGGDQTIAENKQLVLTSSLAPGSVLTGDTVAYSWTCTSTNGHACVNKNDNSNIPFLNFGSVSVNADVLELGTHTLTVTATLTTSGGQTATSTDSCTVTVVGAAAGIEGLHITTSSAAQILLTHDSVTASFSVDGSFTASDWDIAWTHSDNMGFTVIQQSSDMMSAELTQTGGWTPGQITFTITLTHKADSSSKFSASATVDVNSPPSGGTLTLSQTTLASLDSDNPVTLTASGWGDPDHNSLGVTGGADSSHYLEYRFFYQQDATSTGSRLYFPAQRGESLTTSAIAAEAGSTVHVGVQVLDELGDSVTSGLIELTVTTSSSISELSTSFDDLLIDIMNTRSSASLATINAVAILASRQGTVNQDSATQTEVASLTHRLINLLANSVAQNADTVEICNSLYTATNVQVGTPLTTTTLLTSHETVNSVIGVSSEDHTDERWAETIQSCTAANSQGLVHAVTQVSGTATRRRLLSVSGAKNTSIAYLATAESIFQTTSDSILSNDGSVKNFETDSSYSSSVRSALKSAISVDATNTTLSKTSAWFAQDFSSFTSASLVTSFLDAHVLVTHPDPNGWAAPSGSVAVSDGVSVFANSGSKKVTEFRGDNKVYVEIEYDSSQCNATNCVPSCEGWDSATETWTSLNTVIPTPRDNSVKCWLPKPMTVGVYKKTSAPTPIVYSVRANGGCLNIGNSAQYCPIDYSVWSTVITIRGKNFGFSGASAREVCHEPPTHVTGSEDTMLTCPLAHSTAAAQKTVRVTTFGGVSNGTVVTYAFAPVLERLRATGGCYSSGSGLRNCPYQDWQIVTLTFEGKNFGIEHSTAPAACRDRPRHMGGFPTNTRRLTCRLKAHSPGSAVNVVLTTIGGTANTVAVSYANSDCSNGILDGDEIQQDCGGTCLPCSTNPVLTKITASGGCVNVDSSNSVQWCPVKGAGVTLTFEGSDFGGAGASAPAVCADAPTHVPGEETTKLTCTLKDGVPSSSIMASVSTLGGTTGTLPITYAIRPVLESITASGGCENAVAPARGVKNCPANGVGVTLTFRGRFFGDSNAAIDNVCDGAPVHVAGSSNQELTCNLKARTATSADTIAARVTAIGGVSLQSVDVNYVTIPTCSDNVKNGDEQNIDCGGSCPVCVANPSVSAITSTGGCSPHTPGTFGADLGLLWCPIDPTGVRITFIGTNFGSSGARADMVCTGPMTHSTDSPNSIVSCDLKPGVAGSVVDVTISKTGGRSAEKIVLGYALAPKIVSIRASDGSTCGINPDDNVGLINCPADGGGTTLTFLGTGFGVANTKAPMICAGADGSLIHLSREDGLQRLVCSLKPHVSGELADVSVFITAIGGVSNSVTVGYIAAPTCSDGRQNGDETGKDCGGSCIDCVLAPKLDRILASGTQLCTTNGTGVAWCPVNNEGRPDKVVLTFVGSNFGVGNATAPNVCAGDGKLNHVSGEQSTLATCTLKDGVAGSKVEAYVAKPGAVSNAIWISYAIPPTLTSITSNGGCTTSGNTVVNCPRSGTGVALTFRGTAFGVAGAMVPSVCANNPVHTGGDANRGRQLVCNLKGVSAGSTTMEVAVVVQAIGGNTEAMTISYGPTPSNALYTPTMRWSPFDGQTDVLGPMALAAGVVAVVYASTHAFGLMASNKKNLAQTVV